MGTVALNTNDLVPQEPLVVEQYGEEVLCSGWIPQLSLVEDCLFSKLNGHVDLLSNPLRVDVDEFLRDIYQHLR